MPELPEVETVKESLKLRLSNKKIIRARVLWDNIISYPSKDEFIKEITEPGSVFDTEVFHKLVAAGGALGNNFGISVAVSKTSVVVGA